MYSLVCIINRRVKLLVVILQQKTLIICSPVVCNILQNESCALSIINLYVFFRRKVSDGLFLDTSRRIAKEYPDIEHNDMIIDNCCMQLVSNPHQFDVMIMTNLYGSIVSNVVCGIIGGAGLLSGKNYGDHVSHKYIFTLVICNFWRSLLM